MAKGGIDAYPPSQVKIYVNDGLSETFNPKCWRDSHLATFFAKYALHAGNDTASQKNWI